MRVRMYVLVSVLFTNINSSSRFVLCRRIAVPEEGIFLREAETVENISFHCAEDFHNNEIHSIRPSVQIIPKQCLYNK